MGDRDDNITLSQTSAGDSAAAQTEDPPGESEEFSGVFIPTVEGRRFGSPGIDLLKKEVRDQSLGMRENSVERILDDDFSDGEKAFLDQAPELLDQAPELEELV